MKPEIQRIAIAGFEGWRPGVANVNPDHSKAEGFWFEGNFYVGIGSLPDYLNDLNAICKVVNRLRHSEGSEWYDYRKHLMDICGSVMNCIQATAEQRSEALLKTLGFWA